MPDFAIFPAYKESILSSLKYQGDSNDCGPYTAVTVINALLGKNLNADQLAQEMNHPTWRGYKLIIRRIPNWATLPWGIVDVFQQHGLQASWHLNYNSEKLLTNLQLNKIIMPIIGSWYPLWAHIMILVAWDPQYGWGFADTQSSHHKIKWLTDQVFMNQWKALFRIAIEVTYS
jgi:hypothetical protein